VEVKNRGQSQWRKRSDSSNTSSWDTAKSAKTGKKSLRRVDANNWAEGTDPTALYVEIMTVDVAMDCRGGRMRGTLKKHAEVRERKAKSQEEVWRDSENREEIDKIPASKKFLQMHK